VPTLEEAITAADTLTDPASMGATRTIRAVCLVMLGDGDRLDVAATELIALGRRDPQHLVAGVALAVPRLIAQGDLRGAVVLSEEVLSVPHVDTLMMPLGHASRALALASAGEYAPALEAVTAAMADLNSAPIFMFLAAYTSLLDALDVIATRSSDHHMTERATHDARRLRRQFTTFALGSPFARPSCHYYRGRAAAHAGRRRRARSHLKRSVRLAHRHGYASAEERASRALSAIEVGDRAGD
jgi:hypothetical protein